MDLQRRNGSRVCIYIYTQLCKFISNRLHAKCGGGKAELQCRIDFDFNLEFYTSQYFGILT